MEVPLTCGLCTEAASTKSAESVLYMLHTRWRGCCSKEELTSFFTPANLKSWPMTDNVDDAKLFMYVLKEAIYIFCRYPA